MFTCMIIRDMDHELMRQNSEYDVWLTLNRGIDLYKKLTKDEGRPTQMYSKVMQQKSYNIQELVKTWW